MRDNDWWCLWHAQGWWQKPYYVMCDSGYLNEPRSCLPAPWRQPQKETVMAPVLTEALTLGNCHICQTLALPGSFTLRGRVLPGICDRSYGIEYIKSRSAVLLPMLVCVFPWRYCSTVIDANASIYRPFGQPQCMPSPVLFVKILPKCFLF